jgi:hypothetical protein
MDLRTSHRWREHNVVILTIADSIALRHSRDVWKLTLEVVLDCPWVVVEQSCDSL